MMNCEVELWYDEYVEECKEQGITPKSIAQWWEELV